MVRGIIVAVGLLSLGGCASTARWQVVQIKSDVETPVLVDTATGETWRMQTGNEKNPYWEKLERADLQHWDGMRVRPE